MPLNADDLKKQLAKSELEIEHAKAHLYRLDGVVQTLKHVIAEVEGTSVTDVPAPVASVKE